MILVSCGCDGGTETSENMWRLKRSAVSTDPTQTGEAAVTHLIWSQLDVNRRAAALRDTLTKNE